MDAICRAEALIGTPFRLQGRDPASGLDCVGLVLKSFALCEERFPRAYSLARHSLIEMDDCARSCFRRVARTQARRGDVLVFKVGERRLHVALHAGDRFIQADAAIGRVVERPLPAEWPLMRVYRFRRRAR